MSIGRLAIALELGYTITTNTFGELTSVQFPVSNSLHLMFTTVALVAYFYWNIAEAGFSVLAICLPAIFHLTRHVRSLGPSYLIGGKGPDLGSSSASINTTDRGSNHPDRVTGQPDWDNLYDGPGFGTYVTVSGGGSTRPRLGEFGKSSPRSDGINVTQDVEITMTDFA